MGGLHVRIEVNVGCGDVIVHVRAFSFTKLRILNIPLDLSVDRYPAAMQAMVNR